MSPDNSSPKRGPGNLTGLLILLMGLGVLAITFGVIPTDPANIHVPGWVLAVFGGAFVVVGLWVIFLRAIQQNTAEANWINFLLALAVMLATAVICLWIGFGPGPRFFVSHNSLTGHPTALITDPTLGRLFFGLFGCLMTGMALAFAILQGRKLL